MSQQFGFDRGEPIDRYYITEFIAKYCHDIKGHVMECGDRRYTRFGGKRVKKSDVLMPLKSDSESTIIADLSSAVDIPENTFDSIILTQVLHCVYNVRCAINTIHRILKPGGVVLVTLPSITKADQSYTWPFLWGFTFDSARRLFEEEFGSEQVEMHLYGNIVSATAFLYGLAAHEIQLKELNYLDPNFQVIIGVRAKKSS
ncbi:MAG: methyltransferase domain-containing protein [Desulfobacterales bacterium]|nr:methyltransferase domain-containing protein [Desulfobacterales bacterium]